MLVTKKLSSCQQWLKLTSKPSPNHVQMKASFSKACTRETALVMTIVSRSGCAGCHTSLQARATLYIFYQCFFYHTAASYPLVPLHVTLHIRRKRLQLLLHKNRKLSCPSSHTITPSQTENTGLPGPERRSAWLPQSEDGILLHNAKCSRAQSYQRSDHWASCTLHMWCYAWSYALVGD